MTSQGSDAHPGTQDTSTQHAGLCVRNKKAWFRRAMVKRYCCLLLQLLWATASWSSTVPWPLSGSSALAPGCHWLWEHWSDQLVTSGTLQSRREAVALWGAGLAGRNSEARTDFFDLMLHVSTVQANVGFACWPLKLHPPSHLAELISIGSFFELLHKVNTLAFLFGQQFQANSC